MNTFNKSLANTKPTIIPSQLTLMMLTNEVAKRLIVNLDIQEGHGLCYFLGVSPCHYNHLAVWQWIYGQLETLNQEEIEAYSFDEMYFDIESCFVHQFPM